MGGIVKGIGKVFHAVGNFVKKYWKPIVIAVAAYFTCGMALAAMAPAATGAAVAADAGATAFAGATATASAEMSAGAMFTSMATATAADVATGAAAAGEAGFVATDAAAVAGGSAGFGGGVAADLGIGAETATAGAEAGSGVLAGGAAEGAATVGGSMAPGAVGAMQNAIQQTAFGAADTGAASGADIASDIGAGAYNDAAGSIAEGASDMSPAVADTTEATAGGSFAPDVVNGAAGAGSSAANAGKGFWDGMSGGQKLQLAGTLFNAASGLFAPGPTRAQQGLWPGGAYFGMDEKGNGVSLGNVYANNMLGSNLPTGISGGQTAPSIQPQAGPPSPDSSFLPAAGPGAANAQSQTAQQSNSLTQANSRNAEFIQSTMQRLTPNVSPAKSTG